MIGSQTRINRTFFPANQFTLSRYNSLIRFICKHQYFIILLCDSILNFELMKVFLTGVMCSLRCDFVNNCNLAQLLTTQLKGVLQGRSVGLG